MGAQQPAYSTLFAHDGQEFGPLVRRPPISYDAASRTGPWWIGC